jgi:hypothetical protein
MNDDDKQREGYDLAKGACAYLSQIVTVIFLIWLITNMIRWATGFGTDDSDLSGWTRSGFRVLVDYKTGIEYLSDGKGGLIRRGEK